MTIGLETLTAAQQAIFAAAISKASLSKLVGATQANTANLRAMIGAALNNDKRGRIVFLGDSFPASRGANNQAFASCRAKGFPVVLGKMLTARGIAAAASYMASDVGIGSGLPADVIGYDPRIAVSGGTTMQALYVLGGNQCWKLPSGTAGANKLTFTPGGTFDRVVLLYAKNNSGQGSFSVSVDGGTTTAATIVDNDTKGVAQSVVNVAAGSTVVTLSNNSGNSYPIAVGVFTSTALGIEIINAGISGTQINQIIQNATAQPWGPMACLAALLDNNAFNITFINGGYNDLNNGRTPDQVQADMSAAIASAKAYGDVIVLTYANVTPAAPNTTQAFLDALAAAQIAAASANGVPFLDIRAITPDYATATAQGLFFDAVHLRGAGQGMVGAAIVNALLI